MAMHDPSIVFTSEERLNLVEIFVDDCMLRQRIHEENLTSLPDFLKLAKKLSLNKATLQVSSSQSIEGKTHQT